MQQIVDRRLVGEIPGVGFRACLLTRTQRTKKKTNKQTKKKKTMQ